MADFVRYEMADGTEVYFETAEGELVAPRGGDPVVAHGGGLREKLSSISAAAQEMAEELRSRLGPDDLELQFNVKLSAEVNWWFISKAASEGAISVTVRWRRTSPPQT